AWRDGVWRGLHRRTAVRSGRDCQRGGPRRRLDQGDVQEISELPEGPPGDGLWTEADQGTRGDDRCDPYRYRPERHAHRSEPSPQDQEARGPRPVRARWDRPPEPRGRPSRLGIHLRSDSTAGRGDLFRLRWVVVVG